MTTSHKIEITPTCDNDGWEVWVTDKDGNDTDDYELQWFEKKSEAISSAREIFNDELTIVELASYDRNYHEYQILAAKGSIDMNDYKTVIRKRVRE